MMNLAFVSYETPFAPCGGIAAVMGRLPAQVQTASRQPVLVITPFHHRIEKTASLRVSHEGNFGIPFEGRNVLVNILRHDDSVPWFFLQPEDRRFFAGQRHPYDVPPPELLRDSLFFGAAVARALQVIGPGQRWSLMLQDWEAATVALAVADHPGSPRAYVTLHNSYDSGVSQDDLWRAGINPSSTQGSTILQRALSVCKRPVFTVSEQFANDLTEDVLQTRIIATQLQEILKARLVGIDNGPFVDLAVDSDLLDAAQRGKLAPLQEWKDEHRRVFLAALATFEPTADRPLWGSAEHFDTDLQVPWFVMAGRDDARQKGYDVAAHAVNTFLEQGGLAQFLFFPIPGDEGRPGLRFLEVLAERFPQRVLVFPFMFREGFMAALRGATYGIMPSLYEPFGMANEFYLNGTVGIGRATGGILQQIIPLRGAASFSPAVARRAARWNSPASPPSGLLFRERDNLPSESADWIGINAARYDTQPQGIHRELERSRYPLFRSMAEELRIAIQDGTRIYQQQPRLYYRLLTNGVAHIQQNFAWSRAAQDYVRYLS